MLSNKAMGAAKAVEPAYAEDVFSTYLYTGNGSTQTITNGIDLAGKGGLVWFKPRNTANNHNLIDSDRGLNKFLLSNEANAEGTAGAVGLYGVTSFNSNGFTLGQPWTSSTNTTDTTQASWTFRKQPKFFDVVTYTGNGVAGRTVAHNLGSVPGCMIVKRVSGIGAWRVYHRSLGATQSIYLNYTDAASSATVWNNTAPTSTEFTVSDNQNVNGSGDTYVAYIFAHDAGGFGLSGNENVVSCGSFTTDAGGKTSPRTLNLGYEPQWVMFKRTDSSSFGEWYIIDNMRGFTNPSGSVWLEAQSAAAEQAGINFAAESTGFNINFTGPANWIYVAIRRGPMKVPELGTTVYNAIARTGTGAVATVTGAGFTPDLVLAKVRNQTYIPVWYDRLRGALLRISSASTGAETVGAGSSLTSFGMDGCVLGADPDEFINGASGSPTYINYFFQRAPSFFDEVCFTLPGATTATYSHNLTVAPELIIAKTRGTVGNWFIYHKDLGTSAVLYLNGDFPAGTGSDYWSTTPTATQFSLNNANLWGNTTTSVAFLFATCAGISKVGSYTGTGTTQAIACGFTTGARFVLIKRTDSTGDWYVWDSARGIVAGNDPYLLLNSTAAEVTGTDYIDPSSAGFEISSTAPAAINASGGSYIFLAVA